MGRRGVFMVLRIIAAAQELNVSRKQGRAAPFDVTRSRMMHEAGGSVRRYREGTGSDGEMRIPDSDEIDDERDGEDRSASADETEDKADNRTRSDAEGILEGFQRHSGITARSTAASGSARRCPPVREGARRSC